MRLRNYLAILFLFYFAFSVHAQTKESKNLTKKEAPREEINLNIDRMGAIEIAGDFLKQKSLDDDYFLDKYLADEIDGAWDVVFLKKGTGEGFGQLKSMRIKIDPKTGVVIENKEQDGFFIDEKFR